MNQCSGCSVDFTSMEAFDSHRVGDFATDGRDPTRRCQNLGEMAERTRKDGTPVFDLLPDGKVGAWKSPEERAKLAALQTRSGAKA